MRTPHPAIAESLSGEFERETREAPLRARIAELEGKLAGLLAKLGSVVDELESRADLYVKGEANDTEWRVQRARGLAAGSRDAAGLIRSALSGSDPTAQALTRLVEAVGEWKEKCYIEAEDEHWEGEKDLADAWDAYLAARSGRRKGE